MGPNFPCPSHRRPLLHVPLLLCHYVLDNRYASVILPLPPFFQLYCLTLSFFHGEGEVLLNDRMVIVLVLFFFSPLLVGCMLGVCRLFFPCVSHCAVYLVNVVLSLCLYIVFSDKTPFCAFPDDSKERSYLMI